MLFTEYISGHISNITNQVSYLFENYGWHLLIATIAFAIIYNKFIGPYLEQLVDGYKQKKFEREYSAKYHKNPDLFSARVRAQQEWVDKMQEKYNREAQVQKEKQKEKEEKKRQEFLDKQGPDGGQRLGDTSDNKKSLKLDYNPLMGGGSSGSTYRPTRRSPCGGGGCGR